MRFTKSDTVKNMVDTLLDYADEKGVDISGVTLENFNMYLDDQFDDGGFARCEKFGDLAWEYALQFGPLESDRFEEKRWECTEAALIMLSRRLAGKNK